MIYELDIRSRKDGNSIGCVLSSEDDSKSYTIAAKLNSHLVEGFSVDEDITLLIDGNEGVFADVYKVEDNEKTKDIKRLCDCGIPLEKRLALARDSSAGEDVLSLLIDDPSSLVSEAAKQARKGERNMLNKGDEVCISTQALYEKYGERLSHGHISPEKGEDCIYYDMYNSEGNVCCMDGEVIRVESTNEDTVVFVNEDDEEPIRFTLSMEEVEVAVFQAYQKDMSIAASKKKSDIER